MALTGNLTDTAVDSFTFSGDQFATRRAAVHGPNDQRGTRNDEAIDPGEL